MEDQKNSYGKRPLWQWVVIYLIIGGIIYAGIYYFFLNKTGSYNYSQAPTPAGQANQTSSGSSISTAQAMQVTVTGSEFKFDPAEITAKAGQPVELTFKNGGTYPHNLTISDLNEKTKNVQPGQQETITFTPTKAGSFTFICTMPGHADQGMKGTLVVQ